MTNPDHNSADDQHRAPEPGADEAAAAEAEAPGTGPPAGENAEDQRPEVEPTDADPPAGTDLVFDDTAIETESAEGAYEALEAAVRAGTINPPQNRRQRRAKRRPGARSRRRAGSTGTGRPDTRTVPMPRSVGHTARPHRRERNFAQFYEKARRELAAETPVVEIFAQAQTWYERDVNRYDRGFQKRAGEALLGDPSLATEEDFERMDRALKDTRKRFAAKFPDWTAAEVLEEAIAELARLYTRVYPAAAVQFDRLAPTVATIRRDKINETIEVAALRATPQMTAVEDLLAQQGRPRGPGRPSDYRLHTAVLQRCALEKGNIDIKTNVDAFLGSDGLLDWAYGEPVHESDCGIADRSVRATLQTLLNRRRPEVLVAVNVELLREMAERDPDIGRWMAVDGTKLPADLEQVKAYGDLHEALLRRGMESGSFTYHGSGEHGDSWRGPIGLVLVDIKTSRAVVWLIHPGPREFPFVIELVERLYAMWPECPLEYIVGDKDFDVTELHKDLEERFGIHLVTPWRKTSGETNAPGSRGTPFCHCGRHPKPMTLKQSEYFTPAPLRRRLGIEPGDRVEVHPSAGRAPAHRWACEACGSRARTKFRDDPRRHCYVPREGVHKDRIALRAALLLRRNVVESLFGVLKHRGVGNEGATKARWVRSDQQMEWLMGMCFFGETLRRAIHFNDQYAPMREEAERLRLVKIAIEEGQGRDALLPRAA